MEDDNTKMMFTVGDHVYYDKSECAPYFIGKIENFKPTPAGNVMAKVLCYHRRCNLPTRTRQMEEELNGEDIEPSSSTNTFQVRHRELFLTNQTEVIAVLTFRGKCNVTLLSDTEAPPDYTSKEDTFYYFYSFNNMNNTLTIDKKEIDVGARFQADIPALTMSDDRDSEELETLMWHPESCMSEEQIQNVAIVMRSVGMLARAVDHRTRLKPPLLQLTAAAASRDVTLQNTMDIIHQNEYNLSETLKAMVQRSGLVLCRDEMEKWTPSEANLFQDALDMYGKNFALIRADILPWKSLQSIVEYYYMWKTTERSLQLKHLKLQEEIRIRDVRIPREAVQEPRGSAAGEPGAQCESCREPVAHGHCWGQQKHLICHHCWVGWKKYAAHTTPNDL